MDEDRFSSQVAPLTWADSRAARIVLVLAYVALAAAPVVIAAFAGLRVAGPLLVRLGAYAALLAFAVLALQVVLSARLRLLDRPFGLDRVMRVHKRLALAAAALLIAHPVLLALGHRSTWLFTLQTSWRVNLGKLALLVLLLVVLFALLFRRVGLGYERWRALHKGAVLVLVIGSVHAFTTGRDMGSSGMRIYAALLLAAVSGAFLYRNAFVPLRGRRRFLVASVAAATPNTWTLTLQPQRGEVFRYRPGQFMFLKLVRPGRPSEEHPFTIASSPTQEGAIAATIKESGDFTRTIGRTKPRDTALIEAPFGRFSFLHDDPRHLLFIAGGVGITPIMSMLRYLRDTGDPRPAILLYGSQTWADIIFREELAALPGHIKVVHVLSAPDPDWTGLAGYITGPLIQGQARDALAEAHIYLCGPPAMMQKVLRALRDLGVDKRRIHYERFAL